MDKEFKAKFTADNSDLKGKMKDTEKAGKTFSDKMRGFAKLIGGAWLFAKVIQGLKTIVKATAEFEHALAGLSAITGAVGKDLEFYSKAAREIGRTTTIGASQVVEAFKLMGSARPELLKNKEALASVTKEALILAEASGLELATAVNAVAASMSQFNLPASEAARVINAIAAGSLEGAAEVDDLTLSMKNVGTVAADSNMTLEHTIAALEVLGEKQLKGAEAGTKLRGALMRMKEAGVGYTSGQFNMRDALVEVNSKLKVLGTELERDALKSKVFGVQNITAGSILLQNIEIYDKLAIAVTGTNTAYDQQAIMLDTLSAKWKIFTNTIADYGIQGKETAGVLKDILGGLINLVKWTRDAQTESLKYNAALKVIADSDLGFWDKLKLKLTTNKDTVINTAREILGLNEVIEETVEVVEVVNDVVTVQAKTIADYRKEITDLTDSLETLGLTDGKRAEQIRTEIAILTELINKTLEYKTAVNVPFVAAAAPTIPGLDFSDMAAAMEELAKANDEITESLKGIKYEYNSLESAALAFSEQVKAAGIQGSQSMEDFGKTALNIARQVIAAYVAEAIAGAVKSALVGVPFPFNLMAAGIAGGVAAAAINAAIPNFAAGGGVSGPTMAMVGEAPGISRSNPEYIGTASQLAQMGIGGGRLTARVSRGDLLFILNEGKSSNMRNY